MVCGISRVASASDEIGVGDGDAADGERSVRNNAPEGNGEVVVELGGDQRAGGLHDEGPAVVIEGCAAGVLDAVRRV